MNKLDFDISKLSEYREDNCLEVKKATNGLPNSIWETYSSFANSEGGLGSRGRQKSSIAHHGC